MDRSFALSGQCGFTLVELNVALVIVMLVSGLTVFTYVLATRWFESWRQAIRVENTAHLLLHRVASDLRYTARLTVSEDSTWRLVDVTGATHHYRFEPPTLFRDGVRMHDADVAVDGFRLKASRPTAPSYAWKRSAVAPAENLQTRVRIRLIVSYRGAACSTATAVVLRQARPWGPLSVYPEPGT